MTPADDAWPLVIAPGWTQPVPLERPVNTAGAEDSPFITPDGQTLYFVFTPDVRVPVEQQILDGVTGIWVTHHTNPTLSKVEGWSEPERVLLADPGELHLDGCEFVLDDWMVFCSVREGNAREIDLYTAALRAPSVGSGQSGVWTDWQNWGEPLNVAYQVGEMHITADGRSLYFGSGRPGGYGGMDLWVSEKIGDTWSEPINSGPQINTDGDENRPFVTTDGQELWFDSTSRQGHPGPAIFRSTRQTDGSWGEPEEIISSFAGEPTLTGDGRTLYFVHHYFSSDLSQMIEADIYVSMRIEP
jgi:Tol biopolymer transport system component